MKVDIVEKLEKTRRDTRSTAGKLVSEVGLLMDPDNQRETSALKMSGLNAHLNVIEQAQGNEITRSNYEAKYGGKVFTKAELKDLCVKYDLRLLPAKQFNGKVDDKVGKKLADFIETHKSEVGGYSDDFHILAPGSSFRLRNRPVKVRNVDPVMLYRIPKSDGLFVFLHKWGADFTVWRRVRGYFFESVGNMFTVLMSTYLIVCAVMFGLLNDSFVGGFWQHLHILWMLAISAAAVPPTLGLMFGDFEDWDDRETRTVWDNDMRRR